MENRQPGRRMFLKLAGAGLSLPLLAKGGTPRAGQQYSSPMDGVCKYVASSRLADLPSEVVQKAKHHLLDTLAAMISGSKLKVGKLAFDFASSQGGIEEAQVVGSGLRTSAINAALANGILAHADETDDSHEASGTHPGCSIVPAALATAERTGAGGRVLLRGIVAGYDICCRINAALDRELLGNSNHSTHAIGGLFGAATAAASILGLDSNAVRYAFDYAGQQASGVRYWVRDTEHIEKAFVFGGMPARNGVTAALLVATGFTGVKDMLAGEGNFLNAFSTSPKPELLTDGLGRRFELMATNIKKYAVGSPIQAPAEALTILIDRHRIKPGDVAGLTVRLPSKGTVDDREMPDINLQYIMAVTLLDGRLTFEAAHSYARMKDAAVLDLKGRIAVVEDPALRTRESSRTAVVEISTRDGQRLREHVTAVPGTVQNPMNTEEVAVKAAGLLRPVIGSSRAERLIETIWNLERAQNIRELRPLLTPV